MNKDKSDKKKGLSPVSLVILIIAIGIFCYAGYNLYGILKVYHQTNKEYADIREQYTIPAEPVPDGADEGESADGGTGTEKEKDPSAPFEVNWEELKAVNSDITGWIYIEAIPDINYPICRGEDNDFYLHRTFEKSYLFSGSIFEDYNNSPYFDDPNTIIYGHNMKNGSMFAKLKYLKDAEKLTENPYMWILTPDGNYRYKIFSVFDTPYNSDTYSQFTGSGVIVKDWAEKMKKQSYVPIDMEVSGDDLYVTLSTCTNDSTKRCVAIAKLISNERPEKHARRKITSASKKDQQG